MDITIGEFIEQMRQGMELMRDACDHMPWEQCLNCPFHSICDGIDSIPLDW